MFFAWSGVNPARTADVMPEAVNASLLGAKTVNGPVLLNVEANPAFITAAFNVEKSGVEETIPLIVLSVLMVLSFLQALIDTRRIRAPNIKVARKGFKRCFIIFFDEVKNNFSQFLIALQM